MTVVDTSVLLDVLVSGSTHGDASAGRLAAALNAGPVVVNDVIAAELAPLFPEPVAHFITRSMEPSDAASTE